MLFSTIEFWLFFVPVLVLVHLLRHRWQNRLLLAAGYFFYAAWDWRFCLLLLVCTTVDYFAAPRAAPGRPQRQRKLAVAISAIVNLGILGVFKYHDFFVHSFADLFRLSDDATNSLLLHLILPVGISFYTFKSISYTVDVYRGKLAPVRSYLDYALFVSFFPELLAGPIDRGATLIPQILQPRRMDRSKVETGFLLLAWGLFKKVYVADALAHTVNVVFASEVVNGPVVYLATVAYAFQIYCDFSGYSDIARGLGRLLGFELMLNFNLPYVARNPAEFWRRWHISLSTWLRDYLYIPLGGNRHGEGKTYRNLMVTMVLGGLWHGARYNFLLWGIFHGVALSIHRLLGGKRRDRQRRDRRLVAVIKVAAMFHLSLVGWLLFRLENMPQLWRLLAGLRSWNCWEPAIAMIAYMAPLLVPLLVYETWQLITGNLEAINRAPWPVRAIFFGVCVSAVLLLNRGGGTPFIYFQF